MTIEVTKDGDRIVYGEGYQPDDMTRRFWEAIRDNYRLKLAPRPRIGPDGIRWLDPDQQEESIRGL